MKRSLDFRIGTLEGAVLPAPVQLMKVVFLEEQGRDREVNYTVLQPEALRGQKFTQEQADRLFPGAEVVTIRVKYRDSPDNRDLYLSLLCNTI